MNATKREKLAAYLLNMYFVGAGDAGTHRVIFDFHKLDIFSDAAVKQVLEDGKTVAIKRDDKETTQTECFLGLADKLLEELDK